MKNFLVVFCLISIVTPAFADVLDPRLTKEDRAKIVQQRQERYIQRRRMSIINVHCGMNLTTKNQKECKQKLKKEYDELLKIVDKVVEINKKYENSSKNLKNASN